MDDTTWLETDVVVVGGGIAGCVAAVRARQGGADVLIVDKARSIRRSGDAGHGLGFVTTFLDAEPGDSAADFTNWYVNVADGLVAKKTVEKIAVEPMHEAFSYVDTLGLNIRDPESGEYRRVARPWVAGGPRIVQFPGDDVKPILTDAADRAGARTLGGVHVAGILKSKDGRACGVIGTGVRDGKIVAIKAKSVVIASGSAERVMQTPSRNPFNTYHRPWHAATGFALCARAGAEAANIEFLGSFLMARGFPNGALGNLAEAGARYVNGLGETYSQLPDDPSIRSFGLGNVRQGTRELLEGRGPLFLDTTVITEEALEEVLGFIHLDGPAFISYIEQSGLDLRRDMIELELFVSVWSATGSPKGVLVGERCETNVPGLFVIGDLATPSYSFSGAITTGYVAGIEAAKEANERGHLDADAELFKSECERLLAPLSAKGEVSWKDHELRLQETMCHYVGITRSRLGLERCEAHLCRLEEESKDIPATTPHDLMRVLEGQDLVLFDRMMTAAALAREESRFAYLIGHYRSDFPNKDDDRWKGVANIVTWRNGMAEVSPRKMNE